MTISSQLVNFLLGHKRDSHIVFTQATYATDRLRLFSLLREQDVTVFMRGSDMDDTKSFETYQEPSVFICPVIYCASCRIQTPREVYVSAAAPMTVDRIALCMSRAPRSMRGFIIEDIPNAAQPTLRSAYT